MADVAKRDGGFYKVVSPSYFTAMRLKLIKGRALSDRDVKGATPALVMNDRWRRDSSRCRSDRSAHSDPGNRSRQDRAGGRLSWEVVGVVASEKIGGPGMSKAPACMFRTNKRRSTA